MILQYDIVVSVYSTRHARTRRLLTDEHGKARGKLKVEASAGMYVCRRGNYNNDLCVKQTNKMGAWMLKHSDRGRFTPAD